MKRDAIKKMKERKMHNNKKSLGDLQLEYKNQKIINLMSMGLIMNCGLTELMKLKMMILQKEEVIQQL